MRTGMCHGLFPSLKLSGVQRAMLPGGLKTSNPWAAVAIDNLL